VPPSKEKEKPIEIEKKNLILPEGKDAYLFCIWAYQGFGAADIQVLNFGGIAELRPYLKMLINLPNYEKVKTIVIARDAEKDSSAAVQSVKDSLKNAGLSVPEKPFEFAGSLPKIACMIFHGFIKDASGKESLSNGTLEDLCLEIVKNDPAFECVEHYMNCLEKKSYKPTHPHKAKLHAYLAGKDGFAGLKIGEAARVGAWDWSHSKLDPFKRIILGM
jgi:hypothetical protein